MPLRRALSAPSGSSRRPSFVSLPPSLVRLSEHLKASAELLDQQQDEEERQRKRRAAKAYDPNHPLSRIQLAIAVTTHAFFLDKTVEKETRDFRQMYREFLRVRTLSPKEMRQYILTIATGMHILHSSARVEHLQTKCLEIFFVLFLPAFIPFCVTILLPMFLLVSPICMVLLCLSSLRLRANNIWEEHHRLQQELKESLLRQQWNELRTSVKDSSTWTRSSLETAFSDSPQLTKIVLTEDQQGSSATRGSSMIRRKKGFHTRSFSIGGYKTTSSTKPAEKRRKSFLPSSRKSLSWPPSSAKAATSANGNNNRNNDQPPIRASSSHDTADFSESHGGHSAFDHEIASVHSEGMDHKTQQEVILRKFRTKSTTTNACGNGKAPPMYRRNNIEVVSLRYVFQQPQAQ